MQPDNHKKFDRKEYKNFSGLNRTIIEATVVGRINPLDVNIL